MSVTEYRRRSADSPTRRQQAYEVDLTRTRELAQSVALETAGVLSDPGPDVLVNLKVRFHTDLRRSNWLHGRLHGEAASQRSV
jgi:hypothetical protein